MLVVYAEWIRKNVRGDGRGQCREVTQAMAAAFPGLKRVRGHYWCPVTSERVEHWWLVTGKEVVVDPTAAQFPSAGNGRYEPWDENAEEPIGTCLTCGEYRFRDRDDPFCSDECMQRWVDDPT